MKVQLARVGSLGLSFPLCQRESGVRRAYVSPSSPLPGTEEACAA